MYIYIYIYMYIYVYIYHNTTPRGDKKVGGGVWKRGARRWVLAHAVAARWMHAAIRDLMHAHRYRIAS